MEQEQILFQQRQRRNIPRGLRGCSVRYDTGWELFGAYAAKRLRAFYLQAGLALLVLVAAGIFAAAAWAQPGLFGDVAGGRRTEVIFLFCGIPAILLAGIYFAFLRPRAVLEAYDGYARACAGGSLEESIPGETSEQTAARQTGVYWWAALPRVFAGIFFGAAAYALSSWLGTRGYMSSWVFAAIWTACSVLYWQSRTPLMLALTAATREPVSGRSALKRGLLLFRRARYDAVNDEFRTLLAAALPLAGVLALSLWIAKGNALVQYSIAAFLLALIDPPLRLLIAAFDVVTYAKAARKRLLVKRCVCRAGRLRMRHDGWKGQET